jgi:hypothetical protein
MSWPRERCAAIMVVSVVSRTTLLQASDRFRQTVCKMLLARNYFCTMLLAEVFAW